MAASGYVKVWREMLDHEVMQDDWLCRLWMWCLLRAGYQSSKAVKRGEFVTSRAVASEQLKVSPSKWYRGIERLRELGCVTVKAGRANKQWTTITVCNFAPYQDAKTSPRTTQRTSDETTGEHGMRTAPLREELEERKKGAVAFAKPSLEEVRAYCQQRFSEGKPRVEPEQFFNHYEANGWVQGRAGKPVKDWQACVRTWEGMEFRQKAAPTGPVETAEQRRVRITAEMLKRRQEDERLRAESPKGGFLSKPGDDLPVLRFPHQNGAASQ